MEKGRQSNMSKRVAFRFFAMMIVISLAGFGAVAGTNRDSYLASNLESKSLDDSGDDICIKGETYRGCCSNLGGIKDIRGEWIECNKGTSSPTCGGIDVDLSGCCSSKNGIARVDTSRRVLCDGDVESPTCSINSCEEP